MALALVFGGHEWATAAVQREVEAKYQAIPSAEKARAWHRHFTSVPHPATSEANDQMAEYIADHWRQQGIEDVVIRRYDVLSSNPREVKVEMLAPTRYVPSLREDPDEQDPDTKHPDISGGWISFSTSGDITAPVVYANSGNPADYDILRKNGIDPRGKIVVVRYSNPYSYRGFKALTAQREGAAAIIIYSDPAEDVVAVSLPGLGVGSDLRILTPKGLDVWVPWLRARQPDRRRANPRGLAMHHSLIHNAS